MFLHPRIIRDSRQGAAIASRKYNLLRAQQIKSGEDQLNLIGGDVPVLPTLSELLELPPPYSGDDDEPVVNQ